MSIDKINKQIEPLKHKLDILDPFDDFDTLENIEKEIINILTINLTNKTAKFESINGYYILHKSIKKNNVIQVTFFYKDEPTSDREYNTYREAIKELYGYNLKEVI